MLGRTRLGATESSAAIIAPDKTMYVMMIVLALSATGLIGWLLFKERRRATLRRVMRQRHDEATRNWRAVQERARRDAGG